MANMSDGHSKETPNLEDFTRELLINDLGTLPGQLPEARKDVPRREGQNLNQLTRSEGRSLRR
jgi:hypothetical protein